MYCILKEDFGVRIGIKRSYIYSKVNMKEKYKSLNDDAIKILKRVNEGDSYYTMMNNLMMINGESILYRNLKNKKHSFEFKKIF